MEINSEKNIILNNNESLITNKKDEVDRINLSYNNNTYCIDNPNKNIFIQKMINNNYVKYICNISSKDKYCVLFNYKNIDIRLTIKSSIEILLLYIILQYHYDVINIQRFNKYTYMGLYFMEYKNYIFN